MSDKFTASSGDKTPMPRTQQQAAMEVLRAIGAGESEPPSTLAGAKAMVAKLQAPVQPNALPVVSAITDAVPGVVSAGFTPDKGRVRYKRQVGRLRGIIADNYRAFSGRFKLTLPTGENALIYGENGAGKSSLFHAVRDFLEA